MRGGLTRRSTPITTDPVLDGRRVVLRPLRPGDFRAWRQVRRRNVDWLTQWEPRRGPGQPDTTQNRDAFVARCNARQRERQLGSGFGFGVFVAGDLCGEMNLSNIIRGAFQSCHVGYWIDEDTAGRGYTPEALVMALRFAFEDIALHRVQASIIPRNAASRRVVEKLDMRCEGLAERYLEINGVWEDHLRFAMTSEEWDARGDDLLAAWVD